MSFMILSIYKFKSSPKSCLGIKIGNRIPLLLLGRITKAPLCPTSGAQWIPGALNYKDGISMEVKIKPNKDITDNLSKTHAKCPPLRQAVSTQHLEPTKSRTLIYERRRKMKASQTSKTLDSKCV